MKKRIALTLIVAVALTISACGGKTSEVDVNGYTSNESEETDNVEEPTKVEEEIIQNVPVELTNAKKFSEGMAWIKFNNPENYYEPNVGLLNTDGKIITNDTLIAMDALGSEFIGGYSYINYDDGRFVIVDKEGNVTAESPTDGVYNVVTGGDGVYLVHQEVKGMEINEDRYGFIDSTGNWIVPPSIDYPLYIEQRYGDRMFYYYHGNHVFSAYNERSGIVKLYNANTGNIASIIATMEGEDYRYVYMAKKDEDNDYPIGETYKFYNGTLLCYGRDYDGKDHIISIDSDLNVKEVAELPGGDPIRFSSGMYFTGEYKFSNESYVADGGFFDSSGTKVIDLSKYRLMGGRTDGFCEFNDGVAPVLIYGADDEYYFSYIDMSGEFLFEPVQLDHASNDRGHGKGANTAVLVNLPTDGSYYGNRKIITCDGTVQELDEGLSFYDQEVSIDKAWNVKFYDGYAWCEANSCFVGINGQKLNTYVESKMMSGN